MQAEASRYRLSESRDSHRAGESLPAIELHGAAYIHIHMHIHVHIHIYICIYMSWRAPAGHRAAWCGIHTEPPALHACLCTHPTLHACLCTHTAVCLCTLLLSHTFGALGMDARIIRAERPCAHAYTHTCAHAYMHTCAHAYMQVASARGRAHTTQEKSLVSFVLRTRRPKQQPTRACRGVQGPGSRRACTTQGGWRHIPRRPRPPPPSPPLCPCAHPAW